MEAYDYDTYTAADVKRALAHAERTPEDFQALIVTGSTAISGGNSSRQRRSRRENILVTVSICSHQSISQIIARTIAFTVVLTAITKSTVHS